jgi:hypothetical protein
VLRYGCRLAALRMANQEEKHRTKYRLCRTETQTEETHLFLLRHSSQPQYSHNQQRL